MAMMCPKLSVGISEHETLIKRNFISTNSCRVVNNVEFCRYAPSTMQQENLWKPIYRQLFSFNNICETNPGLGRLDLHPGIGNCQKQVRQQDTYDSHNAQQEYYR